MDRMSNFKFANTLSRSNPLWASLICVHHFCFKGDNCHKTQEMYPIFFFPMKIWSIPEVVTIRNDKQIVFDLNTNDVEHV